MGVIKAIAYPNELTRDVNNDYYLLPQSAGTLNHDDIIRRLEAKEIATKNVNGKAFVQLFLRECAIAVAEGYSVITGMFRASVSIKGVVYTEQLGHNVAADRVNVRVNLSAGAYAREEISVNTTVQIAEQTAPTGPMIQKVTNPVAGEIDTLTPGAMVLLQGMRLAVRGDREDEIGVFFTSVTSGDTVRIPAANISPNTPSKLQFVLPQTVTAGEWRVAVATQSTNTSSTFSREVRRFEYPQIVRVE
jgi:uncharacterized membrane protein